MGGGDVEVASWPAMRELARRFGWNWIEMEQYFTNLAQETLPGAAANLAAVGVGALPVITQVGVFVALGSGYAQARNIARAEESALGFSQGFVMGILRWKWDWLRANMWRKYFHTNHFDDAMDAIRMNSYNDALTIGFVVGRLLRDEVAKAFERKIRSVTSYSTVGFKARSDDLREVTRAHNVQRIFVEDLARAARFYGILPAE
jgi:hypothetical protein